MTCKVLECNGAVFVKREQLCARHYMRLKRHGDAEAWIKPIRGVCSRDDCERPHCALGLCETHYRRSRTSSIQRPMQPCLTCGGRIPEDRAPLTRYCSPSCKAATKNARQANRPVRERVTACVECGGSLTGHRSRTICSDVCTKKRAQRRQREQWLERLYGLTPDDYNAMLARQNGGCAGCGTTETLCVDHDKTTGVVRGILCRNCNIGVGALRHDVKILERLGVYLRA